MNFAILCQVLDFIIQKKKRTIFFTIGYYFIILNIICLLFFIDYYQDVMGILLVYDITNEQSFKSILQFLFYVLNLILSLIFLFLFFF